MRPMSLRWCSDVLAGTKTERVEVSEKCTASLPRYPPPSLKKKKLTYFSAQF